MRRFPCSHTLSPSFFPAARKLLKNKDTCKSSAGSWVFPHTLWFWPGHTFDTLMLDCRTHRPLHYPNFFTTAKVWRCILPDIEAMEIHEKSSRGAADDSKRGHACQQIVFFALFRLIASVRVVSVRTSKCLFQSTCSNPFLRIKFQDYVLFLSSTCFQACCPVGQNTATSYLTFLFLWRLKKYVRAID